MNGEILLKLVMKNSIKLITAKLGVLELTSKQIEANLVYEKCLNKNQREMEKTFKSRNLLEPSKRRKGFPRR